MANLWQKQEGSGETAGSNALLTRDKRLRSFMESVGNPVETNHTGGAARTSARTEFAELPPPTLLPQALLSSWSSAYVARTISFWGPH